VIAVDDWVRLTPLALAHDVVIAQWLPVPTMIRLARSTTVAIYDLYDPVVLENLAVGGNARTRQIALNVRATDLAQEIALLTGDAFICASETQRDLWLGALVTLGRIDRATYLSDPGLKSLVAVAPFGLDLPPPQAPRGALRRLTGASAEDKLILWGGGIWDWLDPCTVIDAVHAMSATRNDLRLIFLGVRHPNPDVPAMAASGRAIHHVDQLGIRDRTVFFNFDWIPHDERGAYFADADVGVSAHLDTIEARFAFRTRLVDHIWAGIRTVATKGEVMAETIAREGVGVTVDYGDVQGWITALTSALDDPVTSSFDENLARLRRTLSWAQTTAPLANMVLASRKSRTARPHDKRVERYFATRLRLAAMHRGRLGLAEHLASEARRFIRSRVGDDR
jgi:glycosyltransferase involved in cell wall biosynthesis